jgi:hypothetical protein
MESIIFRWVGKGKPQSRCLDNRWWSPGNAIGFLLIPRQIAAIAKDGSPPTLCADATGSFVVSAMQKPPNRRPTQNASVSKSKSVRSFSAAERERCLIVSSKQSTKHFAVALRIALRRVMILR